MYKLGEQSQAQLVGCDPELIAVVVLAIKLTESDFSVFDGIRGIKQQQHMIATGVSKSKDSYHLYGLAVDLVPYFDGRNWWDSTNPAIQKKIDKAFKDIAVAMNKAADIIGIKVDNGYKLWGWDKPHWQRTGHRQIYDIRKLKHEL